MAHACYQALEAEEDKGANANIVLLTTLRQAMQAYQEAAGDE
jgi:hypothetical protein